jgi:hypothetical protein
VTAGAKPSKTKLDAEEVKILRNGIGDPLRDASSGESYERIAVLSGVHRNTVEGTINGRTVVRWDNLRKMVRALGEPEEVWKKRRQDTIAELQKYRAARQNTDTDTDTDTDTEQDDGEIRRRRRPILTAVAVALFFIVLSITVVVLRYFGGHEPAGPPPAILGTIVNTTDGVMKYPSPHNNEGRQNGFAPGASIDVVCQERNGRRASDFDRPEGTVTSTVWDRVNLNGGLWFISDLFVRLPNGTQLPDCPPIP